jgi:hypothetical protein
MPIRYLKYRISPSSSVPLLFGFCFLQASSLYAAEYQYLIEATARAEQIENPQRSVVDEEEEFLSQQMLRGTLSRATSKLVTNIDYQGSKFNYRENLQTDRTFVTGASSIDWIISPERFTWNVSNSRSLQVIDQLQPDTLNNRQVISLTSTGPSIIFQLSGRNRLTGTVEYSIADYEMGALSSQERTTTDLLFSHNFSTSFISSLGGNYLQSSFDDTPMFDFERYEYFWQNEYTTEIVNLNLMLGQTVLVRDIYTTIALPNPVGGSNIILVKIDDDQDQENALIRLTGSYKVNSQSTFDFNYSDSYEDIFSNMMSTQLTRVTPIQPIGDRLGNSNLNQNYELVQAGIGYVYTKSEFFGMNFRYSESERTYQGIQTNQNQNQSDQSYHVGANWNLFENLNLNIYGRYTEQEFTDIDREQERNEYGLQAGYRISKSLYAQFGAYNVDQSGTLPIDNYDGLNYWVSLTLSIGNE